MPSANERISCNIERVVKRGAHTLSKRSPNRNIDSIPLKEQSLSFPGLRNLEQRRMIIWLPTNHDSCKLWVPVGFIYLQQNEGDSLSGSEADTILNYPETVKSKNDSHERPNSANSSAASSSSDTSVLEKSRNNKKRSNSLRQLATASQANTVQDTPRLNFDGFEVAAFNNITEEGKSLKKSSRKKGKKKKRHCKRSVKRDNSGVSQCEEGIGHELDSELSVSSHPLSTRNNSQLDLLEEVSSSHLLVQETVKNNSVEISNDWSNRPAISPKATSYSNESQNSKLVPSSPWDYSDEKLCYDQSDNCESLTQVTSSCSSTSSEVISSMYLGNTSNIHPKEIGICDTSSSISDDLDSSVEASSFVDKLKGDTFSSCSDLENFDNAAKSSIKYEHSCNSLEGELISNLLENGYPFKSTTAALCEKSSETSSYCSVDSSDWSKYAVDEESTNERVQCSSEASSSDDFITVVNRKGGRVGRKPSFNSNSTHRPGNGNLHYRSGKENSRPLVQKVQTNRTEGCIYRSRNDDNVGRQHVVISSDSSKLLEESNEVENGKQNSSGALRIFPSDEKVIQTSDSYPIQLPRSLSLNKLSSERLCNNPPEMLKRKSKTSSNQECEGFMKELQSSKFSMTGSKFHAQENGAEITPQVIGSQSVSLCTAEYLSADILPTNIYEGCQSESLQNKLINNLGAKNVITSVPVESGLLEKTFIRNDSSGGIVDSEDNLSMEHESESKHSDNGNSFGPVLEKIFVDSLEVTRTNHSMSDSLQSGEVKLELSIPKLHQLAPSYCGGLPSVGFHSGGAELTCSSFPEVNVTSMNYPISDLLQSDEVKLELSIPNFHQLAPSYYGRLPNLGSHSEGSVFTRSPFPEVDVEVKAQSGTDLFKILQAVDESYKVLTASEAIRTVTGRPLAEFEKFLLMASPTISQCIRSCKTCFQDQMVSDALCKHQVSQISLGNLWQWYEKPGSYGLEVMIDHLYNSRRPLNGRFQFRAYFVPYLSSMQLFARAMDSVCFDKAVFKGEAKEICENMWVNSSCSLKSHPIFSVLVPEPCKESDPSGKGQTSSSSTLTDEELLFEYFEADQPQQRKPLFEKIKELVRGDKSGNSHMFGDPSKLECLNLHDLHPASWFSVAWYPIYRIPDGNLRASFLTYHSLGRIVNRSALSNVISDNTQIALPVVGMQCYNAKGEGWLAQRGFSCDLDQMEKAMSPNPSETLDEKLRTLENAASVMSRATVHRGYEKSVNKHPDYEFFLSRRR